MTRATHDLDSAEGYPATIEVLLAQAGESRSNKKWSSNQRSMVNQSCKTNAKSM
jgi:hypothetical protein